MDRLKRWELETPPGWESYTEMKPQGPGRDSYPGAEVAYDEDAYCEAPEVRKLEDRAAKMEEALEFLATKLRDGPISLSSTLAWSNHARAALDTKEG